MSDDKQKNPAFLFYSSDFLTGVRLMNYEEIGKYITLLCLQHQIGHLKEEEMLKICEDEKSYVLTKFSKDENGKYFNKRLEIESNKRTNYVESRKKNLKKRKTKKHMGDHMENENENENINENRNKYIKKFISSNSLSDKLETTIASWIEYKQERNEKYKDRGFKSLLTQIKNKVDEFGEQTVIDVINNSMASNYKGIIFDNLKKPNTSYRLNLMEQQEKIKADFLRECND